MRFTYPTASLAEVEGCLLLSPAGLGSSADLISILLLLPATSLVLLSGTLVFRFIAFQGPWRPCTLGSLPEEQFSIASAVSDFMFVELGNFHPLFQTPGEEGRTCILALYTEGDSNRSKDLLKFQVYSQAC